MDARPYFSVIVLAWQVERYIEACLRSVQTQRFENFEAIIVVPEGTDDTSGICERFIKDDPRFRIEKTVNRGQLSNRLLGAAKAKGTYLLFLDGDDLWDRELLSTLYDASSDRQRDILIFGYERFIGDRVIDRVPSLFPHGTVFSGSKKKDFFYELIFGKKLNPMWDLAIRAELLEKLSFDAARISRMYMFEDALFVCTAADAAGEILYLGNMPLYRYRMREGSVMHRFMESEIRDYDTMRAAEWQIMQNRGLTSCKERFFSDTAKRIADWIYRCAMADIPMEARFDEYHWLKNDAVLFPQIAPYLKEVPMGKRHRMFVMLFFRSDRMLKCYILAYQKLKASKNRWI